MRSADACVVKQGDEDADRFTSNDCKRGYNKSENNCGESKRGCVEGIVRRGEGTTSSSGI